VYRKTGMRKKPCTAARGQPVHAGGRGPLITSGQGDQAFFLNLRSSQKPYRGNKLFNAWCTVWEGGIFWSWGKKNRRRKRFAAGDVTFPQGWAKILSGKCCSKSVSSYERGVRMAIRKDGIAKVGEDRQLLPQLEKQKNGGTGA